MEHHPILLVQGAHKILHFGSKCGWLGVEFQQVTPDIADRLHLEKVKGALIAEVKPRSPAAGAGIRSGDIVTAINGEDIENAIRSHSMRSPQIVLLPGDMTFGHQQRQEPVREDQCGALAMHAGPTIMQLKADIADSRIPLDLAPSENDALCLRLQLQSSEPRRPMSWLPRILDAPVLRRCAAITFGTERADSC